MKIYNNYNLNELNFIFFGNKKITRDLNLDDILVWIPVMWKGYQPEEKKLATGGQPDG